MTILKSVPSFKKSYLLEDIYIKYTRINSVFISNIQFILNYIYPNIQKFPKTIKTVWNPSRLNFMFSLTCLIQIYIYCIIFFLQENSMETEYFILLRIKLIYSSYKNGIHILKIFLHFILEENFPLTIFFAH